MPHRPSRRAFLKTLAAAGAAGAAGALVPGPLRRLALGATAAEAPTAGGLLAKEIPGTGVRVPVLGMGSWLTFDVPSLDFYLEPRTEVLRRFFAAGGEVIDSSPMYGRSEGVIGECLERLGGAPDLFSATKVWTPLAWHGRRQIEASHELWGVERFDLLQIHNLVAWETHADTLEAHREAGRVRFVGVTTSHGRRHEEMERVLATGRFDFVQLTYNLVDREAERRLLPLAAERGIAVIANRPFRRGALIDRLRGEPLPSWAAEIGCATWPQLLLKWIVSHPAVTSAIPATKDPDHMTENMIAARGRLPDEEMRRRLVRWVDGL